MRGRFSVWRVAVTTTSQSESYCLEASTIRQYRQHLDHHIKPFLGPMKLADLTPGGAQHFRNTLIKEGRSRVMAQKALSSLGSILADAMTTGRVARNVIR